MADDDMSKMKEKNEEIHALQEKSRGMIRLMSSMKPSRRLQVDRAPSAPMKLEGHSSGRPHAERLEADGLSVSAHVSEPEPEETQLQVKLLKAELQDQMEIHRCELSSCKQSAQELFAHRTRSEACISKLVQQAAMESSLAEKNFNARMESEQRVWMEERRRMRSAHHRSLQNEKECMEQLRRQASEELASTNRRLEIEAREVREARGRQRAAEGRLKRSEQKQESYTNLLRGEAVEAEAHAEKQHEAARLEASRLQASLAEAEHQVQRQQAMARLQNEMTSKQQASMTLELKAAAEEVDLSRVHEEELLKVLHSEEAYAAQVHRDLGKTTMELNEISHAFQAATAEHLDEIHAAKEEAEKSARLAAELRQKLQHASEVQQLQLQRQEEEAFAESQFARKALEHEAHQEALAQETRLQLKSTEAKLRCVEGSCAEAQMCFDSCYKELLLAQEEATEQKDLREQDLLQLHRACAESLEGLPLVFYEEVCKSFEANEERKTAFTVSRYGHVLEAVASCVHTLLRENTELQDAQRSLLDASNLVERVDEIHHDESGLTSSLEQMSSLDINLSSLTPLNFASLDGHRRRTLRQDRPRDREPDAPQELHREVFAMHQELANSREELRQFLVQKEIERDVQEAKLCKASGDMSQMRLEMDEMHQSHLQELFVFQQELEKLRSKTTPAPEAKAIVETPTTSSASRHFPGSQWRQTPNDSKSSRTAKGFRMLGATATTEALRSIGFKGGDKLIESHERSSQSHGGSDFQHTDVNRSRTDSQFSFRDMDWEISRAKAQGEERVELAEPNLEESKQSMLGVEENSIGSQSWEDVAISDSSRQVNELPAFGSPAGADSSALKKAYAYAETLCDAQRYREALPLLDKIIDVGHAKPQCLEAAGIRPADVWAYTGVAKQGESLTEESINAYCEAIRLDPLLHVCHANLASLYSFQEDNVKARQHISFALQLDPYSQAYVELAKKVGFEPNMSSP